MPVEEMQNKARSLIGGSIIFLAKYLIPLLILQAILYRISLKAGVYYTLFLPFLPSLLSPILLGRLSGAFIAGEKELEDNPTPDAKRVSLLNSHDPTVVKAAVDSVVKHNGLSNLAQFKKIYDHHKQYLDQMNEKEIADAIKEAESAETNLYTLLSLSYLYQKAGREQEAINKAGRAIALCLSEGQGMEAAKLYQRFSKQRTALNLSPNHLPILAQHLLNLHAYSDAAWCYLMALSTTKAQTEEYLLLQKRFFTVPDTASKQGNPEVAISLYQLFYQQFPDSSLAPFAKQAEEKEQKKLNNQAK